MDVQQQRAAVDLERGGRSGGRWQIYLDKRSRRAENSVLKASITFWCLGTCPRTVFSLWELQMLPLVENSKEEKYWKYKDIPAYRKFKVPVFSFLTFKNLKLNIVKSPSKSEHSQRFLASARLHYRPVQHSPQHKIFSP